MEARVWFSDLLRIVKLKWHNSVRTYFFFSRSSHTAIKLRKKKYDFYNAEIVYTNHWMQLAIKWKSLLLCLYVGYCETNMTVTYFVLSRITRFIQNILISSQLCRLDSIFVFNFTFQTKPIQTEIYQFFYSNKSFTQIFSDMRISSNRNLDTTMKYHQKNFWIVFRNIYY